MKDFREDECDTSHHFIVDFMTLPLPTAQEISEFRALYQAEFGVVLSENEATEAATRTLQLFYLATYGLHHMANHDEQLQSVKNDAWDTSSTPAKVKKTKDGKSSPSVINSK
jgi:hypothetical protein